MVVRRTVLITALLAAASALTFAAAASAAKFRGVVVHDNHRAHSFVIAASRGKLTALHARHLPRVGRVVEVRADKLRNGTWSAKHVRTANTKKRIRARGVVTFVNLRRHMFVLSSKGASLIVRERHAGRQGQGEVEVGDDVAVAGIVRSNEIEARHVEREGHDPSGLNVEGVIKAVNSTARTLTLSADDDDRSAGSLAIHVPASFDLSLFHVGEPVELIVSPGSDGSYTLLASSDDSDAHHANDSGEIQGDEHADRHGSHGGSGSGGESSGGSGGSGSGSGGSGRRGSESRR